MRQRNEPDPIRRSIGQIAAFASWANTVDRTARTRNGRANGPGELEWHLRRLPEKFNNATEAQRIAAAEAARREYFARLGFKSAKARRRGGDSGESPAA